MAPALAPSATNDAPTATAPGHPHAGSARDAPTTVSEATAPTIAQPVAIVPATPATASAPLAMLFRSFACSCSSCLPQFHACSKMLPPESELLAWELAEPLPLEPEPDE